MDIYTVLRELMEAAEALADSLDSLPSAELHGDAKKVKPANMFLSMGESDVRAAIENARRILNPGV